MGTIKGNSLDGLKFTCFVLDGKISNSTQTDQLNSIQFNWYIENQTKLELRHNRPIGMVVKVQKNIL